jgi:hypothetical protein
MKTIFSILVIIALCQGRGISQEQPPRGLLNLVNLIPGNVPCHVWLNGKEMLPGGMKSGAETGWFALPAGGLEISVKSGDSIPVTADVQLVESTGTVIAIFLKPFTKTNVEGKPLPPKMQLKSFPTHEGGKYGLRIISLCPEERIFGFGSVKTKALPLEPIVIKTWAGAAFDVSYGGKPIGRVGASPQKANFYVFIAPGTDGSFFAAAANSDQLGIPRVPRTLDERKTP